MRGAIAVIWLSESSVNLLAAAPPNLTAVAPSKSLPEMTTELPPAAGPAVGENAVIFGAS